MTSADPPWAHEKTALYPHDPRWGDRAEGECARLAGLLAPWLADGVEHVGSTAVPGLAAKPVLDIMASVTDPEAVVQHASGRLADDGWCYVPPELDSGGSWRRFFVKPDAAGQRRIAHLHVIRAGHPRWAEQIAFRDALRRGLRRGHHGSGARAGSPAAIRRPAGGRPARCPTGLSRRGRCWPGR